MSYKSKGKLIIIDKRSVIVLYKISDMMEKEVVNVNNGKKLGFINDIELDINDGKIRALIVYEEGSRMYILGKGEVHSIFWDNIVKIGCDTILVDVKTTGAFEDIDI